MKSRLPAFLSKDKICIICEGDEEYEYSNAIVHAFQGFRAPFSGK